MACKTKTARAFLFILAAALLTACVTGCSSTKTEPAFSGQLPETGLTEADLSVSEPEPVPEPTLIELTATLDAVLFTTPETLFTAPAALPAGDRLARKYQTELGGFLADAERGFLAEHGILTDFAFLNAEIIRAGLPAGPVTKQDIERVLPFGQKIVVAEMGGSQLLDLFAFIGALPQGAAGFAQVSEGVSYTLSFDETGFSAELGNLLVGGESVDEERVYRVALNDFVAGGGNGYSFFLRDDVVKVETTVGLAEAIADYCTIHADSLYMNQGERITILGGITE